MKIQNKIYLTLVIFTLISLILILFLIYPTFADIKKGSEEVLLSREKVTFIYTQNEELDKFKENFDSYKTNLNQIDDLFIDPRNPVDFLKFLEETSSSLNVNIDINLIDNNKEEKSANNPLFSSFKVGASGEFKNILKFYKKLENSPYLLQINNLSINSSALDTGSQTSNMVETIFEI